MEAAKVEMTAVIATAKKLSKQGMYGKAVTLLENFAQKIDNNNIVFSFWDDLLCWETSGMCGETIGEMGVGGCCCGILALVLAGWGCACLCPECGCCGECSSEFFDTCICDTGKGIWEACCCCYW